MWHTCEVLGARSAPTDSMRSPTLGVPFALRLGGHDERIFESGEMVLSTWEAGPPQLPVAGGMSSASPVSRAPPAVKASPPSRWR